MKLIALVLLLMQQGQLPQNSTTDLSSVSTTITFMDGGHTVLTCEVGADYLRYDTMTTAATTTVTIPPPAKKSNDAVSFTAYVPPPKYEYVKNCKLADGATTTELANGFMTALRSQSEYHEEEMRRTNAIVRSYEEEIREIKSAIDEFVKSLDPPKPKKKRRTKPPEAHP